MRGQRGPKRKLSCFVKIMICECFVEFAMTLILTFAIAVKSSEHEDPLILFDNLETGQSLMVNDLSMGRRDIYFLDSDCNLPMQTKSTLMMFALVLCFDAFLKGLYAQVEQDKIFRQETYGQFLLGSEDIDDLSFFQEMIQTMFLLTFIITMGFVSYITVLFSSSFKLIDAEECIVPPLSSSSIEASDLKITNDWHFVSEAHRKVACYETVDGTRCDYSTVLDLQAPSLYFLLQLALLLAVAKVLYQISFWVLEICSPRLFKTLTESQRPGSQIGGTGAVTLAGLRGKLCFEEHAYAEFRWETRLDNFFGFKSWDSDYANNYSSLGSGADQDALSTRLSNDDHFSKQRRPKRLQCSICLEPFHGKDSIVSLPCSYKHIFHSSCAESWMLQQFRNQVA